jgi:hypothetical protein
MISSMPTKYCGHGKNEKCCAYGGDEKCSVYCVAWVVGGRDARYCVSTTITGRWGIYFVCSMFRKFLEPMKNWNLNLTGQRFYCIKGNLLLF